MARVYSTGNPEVDQWMAQQHAEGKHAQNCPDWCEGARRPERQARRRQQQFDLDRVAFRVVQESMRDAMEAQGLPRERAELTDDDRQVIEDEVVRLDGEQHTEPEVDHSGPRVWSALHLKNPQRPRWLAMDRILRAAVSLLVGDENIGKSLLWVWLTGVITTGRAAPGFGIPARAPENVLIVISEDSWAEVRARLKLAGADLGRVRVLCYDDDGSGVPTFPRDLPVITKAAEAEPFGLIVLDAWLDTVAANLQVKDPQQARLALHPWKEIAAKTDAAVLLITHTNRISTDNARDRYGITSELRKVARATLYAQQDENGDLIVGPEKINSAGQIPASRFRIEVVQVAPPTPEDRGTTAKLVYVGQSDKTARQHVADNYVREHGSAEDRAAAWLDVFMAEHDNMVAADEGAKAAADAKIAVGTLARAKKRIGVDSIKRGMEGGWVWIREGSKKNPEDSRMWNGNLLEPSVESSQPPDDEDQP